MTRVATICILSCAAAVSVAAAGARTGAAPAEPTATASGAVELRPKFAPGQVLRYQMELVTTTSGESGGVVQDPQGPSKLVVTWDATVRIEVLPPEAGAGANTSSGTAAPPAAAMRLRMTYEKSSATIQTDGFDPTAQAIQDQYQSLQGHAVEFALDASGKVIDISGGDDVFSTPQAARDAQAWVAQLSAGFGPPGAAAAAPGQKWSADDAATGIPLPDMIWHTDSIYTRNDSCPQAPPDAGAPSAAASGAAITDTCAVILTRVSLVPTKATQKAENNADKNDNAKAGPDGAAPGSAPNGMHSTGTWTSASESLIYISLRTGWVLSVSQNGDEQMDVTVTNEHLESMRYAGTVHSHVELHLLPQ
jgi:hypothetical protein